MADLLGLPQMPIRPISFSQYTGKTQRLRDEFLESHERGEERELGCLSRYIEFGLAGIDRRRGSRYSLDLEDSKPSNEWWQRNLHSVKIRRDFDSLMGRSHDLPWNCSIEVFPLFGYGFQLKKSLHLGTSPYSPRPGYEEHKIPHLVFAKAESHRSSIRLMFPALCGPGCDTKVPVEVKMEVFSEMRAAIVKVCGQMHNGVWPATYPAEEKRARGKGRGRLQVSGKLIPKEKVHGFGIQFLRKLQDYDWGAGAYYFHEIQGVRGVSQHHPNHREVAQESFLQIIDINSISKENWFIDVGYEVSAPNQVLWWDRRSHPWLLKEIFRRRNNNDNNEIENQAEGEDTDDTDDGDNQDFDEDTDDDKEDRDDDDDDDNEDEDTDEDTDDDEEDRDDEDGNEDEDAEVEDLVDRIMTQGRHYIFDPCCQMMEVGGFRLTTTNNIRDSHGIYYIQAYCTEKVATYLQAGQSLQFDYSGILDSASHSKLQKRGQDILDIYDSCLTERVAGNARLELRVRLDRLEELNSINLQGDNLTRTAFAFPSRTYWAFKSQRLNCMLQSLFIWNKSPDEGKSDGKAISLAVAIIYMMNGLNSRPNPYRAENDIYNMLIHACLRFAPPNPVMHLFGILWPNDIEAFTLEIPAPHIPGENGKLPNSVFLRLYKKTLILLRLYFLTRNDENRQARQPNRDGHQEERPPGRRRIIPHAGPEEGAALVQVDLNDVEVADAAGMPRQIGDDLRNQMMDSVNRCLARFYMDILKGAPIARHRPDIPAEHRPYCSLTEAQILSANADYFRDPKLSNIWRRVIVQDDGALVSWNAAIDRLFPTRNLQPSGQNFGTQPYFQQWVTLMRSLIQASRERIQSALRELLNELLWLPAAVSDRLWPCNRIDAAKQTHREYLTLFPENYDGPGPIIIINPNWVRNGGDQWYF